MPARSEGPDRIASSQKKFYLAVKKELASRQAGMRQRSELQRYELAFRRAMPRRVRAVDRSHLLAAIARARVVLVGDFHPFRQSQKGFLRLVEGAGVWHGDAVILALECFTQSSQQAIDEFLAGLLTTEELREQTDFDRTWPFPWESYRDLLVFARDRGLPVAALNVTGARGKELALRARDAAAAARIAALVADHPGATIFVLYGELHLGRGHLPARLRAALGRAEPFVTVHQNEEDLYWKAPTLPDGQKSEVLELRPREFCILNSVPWVKLRSYLDWLEGAPAPDLDDDALDLAEVVHHYSQLLAEALGLPPPPLDTLEFFPPDRAKPRGIRGADRVLAEHSARFRRTGYLATRQALLLPSPSTNSLAEAAAHLLRDSLRPPKSRAALPSADERISQFFLGYLGSKILNPKRKCNEVADLRRMLERGHGIPSRSARQRVATRALALLRRYLREIPPSLRSERLAPVLEVEASRIAGYVLGERYFLALLAYPRLLAKIPLMLRASGGRQILQEAQAGIAKARGRAKSKRERF